METWLNRKCSILFASSFSEICRDRDLVDLAIEKMALGQYDIDELSDIPSSPISTNSQSQHAPPDARSSNPGWDKSAQPKQAPTDSGSLASKSKWPRSQRRWDALKERGVNVQAYRKEFEKSRQVEKARHKIREQNVGNLEPVKTKLAELDQQSAIIRSNLLKMEHPDLATVLAVPPALSRRQCNDLLSIYFETEAGNHNPALGLHEKGKSEKLAKALPSRKKRKRDQEKEKRQGTAERKLESGERSRSIAFKTHHPEIAALVNIPIRLDKATKKHLLAQHKTSQHKPQESAYQIDQNKTVSMQNSSGEKLNLPNEKGGLSTMALHHGKGNAMDNPISID